MFGIIVVGTDRRVWKYNDRVVMNLFSTAWSALSTAPSADPSVDDPDNEIIYFLSDTLWIESVQSRNDKIWISSYFFQLYPH